MAVLKIQLNVTKDNFKFQIIRLKKTTINQKLLHILRENQNVPKDILLLISRYKSNFYALKLTEWSN